MSNNSFELSKDSRRQETGLSKIVRERIHAQGPMTFRDFMDVALYDSKWGFYSRGPSIGTTHGAFNTNARYFAFAFALAQAIHQAEILLGERLRIIELGGGTGELAKRILSFLPDSHEYVIVEVSHGFRIKQRQQGLNTIDHIKSLPSASSFIFGNEVLDALPVHRVMGDGQENLLEQYVTLDEDLNFAELWDAVSTPALKDQLTSQGIRLGRGQVAEINLELEDFLREAVHSLRQGYLVFIDYGDEAVNLYSYLRRNGSLRCYKSQRQVFDPFAYIGEQDLTADVDFTALEAAAQRVGLEQAGRSSQGLWLERLGIHQYEERSDNPRLARNEISDLTSPASLGSTFTVISFKTSGLPDMPGFQ